MALITLENISLNLNKQKILNNISLDIKKEKITTIIGPNGQCCKHFSLVPIQILV